MDKSTQHLAPLSLCLFQAATFPPIVHILYTSYPQGRRHGGGRPRKFRAKKAGGPERSGGPEAGAETAGPARTVPRLRADGIDQAGAVTAVAAIFVPSLAAAGGDTKAPQKSCQHCATKIEQRRKNWHGCCIVPNAHSRTVRPFLSRFLQFGPCVARLGQPVPITRPRGHFFAGFFPLFSRFFLHLVPLLGGVRRGPPLLSLPIRGTASPIIPQANTTNRQKKDPLAT